MNKKNKLHILGVPMNKLGNQLMCNCRSFGCVLLSNQIYLITMYRSTIPIPIYLI